ncbi:hypothetical protein ACO22_01881 [Paracoccidioides brasiliensis]|uniref:Uncharacterized protein n=1 Tax=Paracoccidioides brasiliensis TaxID=121759 RepID=A0A1D2JKH8_PARBR|nr:hypothetical protein ACO22_01881 [Paracoccidioides brasiliensis]
MPPPPPRRSSSRKGSMADMPTELLDQLKTLEELFTVDQAKLKKIVDHFIKELEKVERMLHLSRSHEDRVRLELEAEQQKGGVHWKAQKLDKSESTDRSADDGNQDREIERGSETSIPEQAADKVREHQAQPKPIGAAAQKGESSPPLLKQPNQDTGQKTGVR